MSHRRTKSPGAKRTYGVLVGKINDGQMDPGGRSPHYEIWVKAEGDYRIAVYRELIDSTAVVVVNVLSVDGSDVLAFFDADFKPATKLDLATLASGPLGFTPLRTGPDGQGLDYLRDNLFPIQNMVSIPPEGAGVTLANLLDAQIERAKADNNPLLWPAVSFFMIRAAITRSLSRPSKVCMIST